MATYTTVAVQLLRIWFKSLIDDGRRNALKHMTLVSASRVSSMYIQCTAWTAHTMLAGIQSWSEHAEFLKAYYYEH